MPKILMTDSKPTLQEKKASIVECNNEGFAWICSVRIIGGNVVLECLRWNPSIKWGERREESSGRSLYNIYIKNLQQS